MLLKLKKDQSVKLKISIVFIWFIAMLIILNALYDSYLMYVGEYEYPEFSFLPRYMHYVFIVFGLLVAFGLLFRSKVARWIILFLAYSPIFSVLYFLLIYESTRDIPIPILILGMGFYLPIIYLLSHEDILKQFRVKHLKWEIASFFVVGFTFYLIFTLYMKSVTEDLGHENPFESNSSVTTKN